MAIKNQNSFSALLIMTLLSIATSMQAQDWKTEKKVNLVFGLTQPLLLGGFNIEGNYIHNRFIFDYSHGAGLQFDLNKVTPELKRQGVTVRFPWTTGFGIGYRLKEWVNVRIEPKWHRFDFYYGETQTKENQLTSYNVMSLGVGLYGHYQPFKNQKSFLKGIMIAPSIRYWPTVSSTLKDGVFSYTNKETKTNEEIKNLNPGMGFTPFIFNISVGYSFNVKKKQ